MTTPIPFGFKIDGTPPSADHINKTAHTYATALSSGDVDAILALFAEDALFFDPIAGEPRRGLAEIKEFYTASAGALEFQLEGAVRVANFYAAFAARARVHGFGDEFFVDTLDVLVFNEAGLITQFYAVWGETNNPSPNTNWPPK